MTDMVIAIGNTIQVHGEGHQGNGIPSIYYRGNNIRDAVDALKPLMAVEDVLSVTMTFVSMRDAAFDVFVKLIDTELPGIIIKRMDDNETQDNSVNPM